MAKKNIPRSGQNPSPLAAQKSQNPTFEDKNEAFFRRSREAVEKALFKRIVQEAYQGFQAGDSLEEVIAWNEKTYLDTDPKRIRELVLLAHDACTKGDPCPEVVWPKPSEETPSPPPSKYSDPAEEQDDKDWFYPLQVPKWPLVVDSHSPGLDLNWPPPGWETDRCPKDDSLEAAGQFLDYLTHPHGLLVSFKIAGIGSAEEYVQDVGRLARRLKAAGKISIPFQEETKAYTPHEALLKVEKWKEQLFPSNQYSGWIISHGKEKYSIGNHPPVIVTYAENVVLQAFLKNNNMNSRSLYGECRNWHGPGVLKALETKYGGIFKAAITMAGTKGSGGYQVKIRPL